LITVLIADDHDIVREGLKQIVAETADIVVGGEARTGAEAVELVRRQSWDVVVLDLHLPDRPGLDVLAQIRAIAPALPVLILSMQEHPTYAIHALKGGALGYVTKSNAREHLVTAIAKVARGDRFLTPAMAETLALDQFQPRGPVHRALSDREFQVLCMIAAGNPPREIAQALNVSVKTVATHRARLLEKIGLKIVQYAIEHSLLPERRR
jgi:DNA-binding NarL/FixJ family response regulator